MRKLHDDVGTRLHGEELLDAGGFDRLRHLLATLHVHPEDVVGDEDRVRFDVLQFFDDALRRLFAERRLVKLPHRTEVAFERATARGFHECHRFVEVDVVVIGIALDEMSRRPWIVIEIRTRVGGTAVEPLAVVVELESANLAQIATVAQSIDERRHHFFSVADGNRVDARLLEEFRIP